MRITGISILDTFGTRSAKFVPRSVTRITGPNGSGKSSILRAVLQVFSGGSDPSVVRAGAEKSVVELTLDDGTVITRTCQPKRRRKGDSGPTDWRTELEIVQPDGTPRNAPQTYINELSEAVAVDPGQILRLDATTAPGRKRLSEILLQIMPISFDPAAIEQACLVRSSIDVPMKDPDILACPVPPAALDLDGLKKFAASLTEQRRRIGQTRDDSDGAVARLQGSLPADDSTDWPAKLAEAERNQIKVVGLINERKAEIEGARRTAIETAAAEWSAAVQGINAEIDAKIRALEAERTDRNAIARTAKDVATDLAGATARRELAELDTESQPFVTEAAAAIETAKQGLAAHHRAAGLRDEIEIQLTTCREAHFKYDQFTKVLERLDALRADKLKALPIPELVVEGETVLLGGIPWQNVNTAKRVEVALQLCTLRAGKLGVLFLDDAEHLDTDTRLLLEQEIARAGFQLIEAIVADQPELLIETVEQPVAA